MSVFLAAERVRTNSYTPYSLRYLRKDLVASLIPSYILSDHLAWIAMQKNKRAKSMSKVDQYQAQRRLTEDEVDGRSEVEAKRHVR